MKGIRDGEEVALFVYIVADHRKAYAEAGSQAIFYTAGAWDAKAMTNVEELDPKPFLSLLDRIGLPTRVIRGEIKGEGMAWTDHTG